MSVRESSMAFDPPVDYRHSPHLAQRPLHDRLTGLLHDTLRGAVTDGLPMRVLEIGAGHGGYTETMLAAGWDVTRVEMCSRALNDAVARHGHLDSFRGVHDPDGDLAGVDDGAAVAVCLSVMHHVPDYLRLLVRVAGRLAPGGVLLTLQDPLWYPRVGRVTRTTDRSTYLAWRIAQGDPRQGMSAAVRRLRRRHPSHGDGEISYYHVVRRGVDEEAVAAHLAHRFSDVEVFRYWSHHLAVMQRPADALGLRNTFAVRATGLRPGAG